MYHIIANATHLDEAGRIKLEKVKKVFTDAGKECALHLTYKSGDAKKCAEEITSSEGFQTIVAMGGDGTLHDILNGIKNFDDCALGIVPLGTGNDFAQASGIPSDAEEAAKIIAFRAPVNIDYIELASGLRSINSVGTGIDVDVLKRTYASNNRKKSKYVHALVSSLIHFKSINFTAKYDGKEEKHFGLIAAVGNGKLLGGGIKLFPEAEIDDGYMDLIIVDFISKPKIIGAFLKLMRGKVSKVKNVTFVKTKAVQLIPEENNFTIQAEGELYDGVPLDAHIVEGKLKFYLPYKK